VPAPDPGKPFSAGISPIDAGEVAALFERLKEELRSGGLPAAGEDGGPARIAALRTLAERSWAVSAERPLRRREGPLGAPLVLVKKVLRKLMRWYVEPLAVEQRTFNDAALKLADALSEELDRTRARAQAADRRAGELEERLTRLERRGAGVPAGALPPPVTVAAQPGAAAIPDYFAFESRMRGSAAEIRDRQRGYVELFLQAAPVLDAGCGRGEFLALLREAGVEARGVDADSDMVAFARGEGLEVEQADLLAHLEGLPERSLGGIFSAQVVEHLPPAVLVRFLSLAVSRLRPGGLLVCETVNPLSPLALRSYFADLTHAQPLVPETLELLARQAGFAEVEIRYANPPAERLEPIRLAGDPALAGAQAALDDNVRLLNELLFGPLDYAIVARTSA
jgi:SAM-dependent methyltransferase